MHNLVSFDVATQVISTVLKIPEGYVICGSSYDPARQCINLVVSGPGLPEVATGGPIPKVAPLLTRELTEDGFIVTWDWNLQSGDR